ncbi:hypothetical protein P4H42_17605 [Paenibacillus macerans]|uniref:hypothetical protein n=1 Tax=Paenibacillus macerans TaxID=44252 RepID=UPI002DBBCCEB|nr:hypothetical protein [Paenibacillus macerans]MEC0331430.1 hypothetical protein [Paenibacillus macerans]
MKLNFYKVLSTAALAAIIAGAGTVGVMRAVQAAPAAKSAVPQEAAQAAKAAQTSQTSQAEKAEHAGQTAGLNNVDQKLIDAAQAKLKEFVKEPVAFLKAETAKLGDEEAVCFVISETKMGSETSPNENVTVKRDGTVVNLYLSTSYKELNDNVKAKLDLAWKQAYNKDSSGIERVFVHYTNSEFYFTGLDYTNITAANGKKESVDLINGKLDYSGGKLEEQEVPAAINKAAAEALSRAGATAKGSPDVTFGNKPNGKKVYYFTYGETNKGEVKVNVEETTNRLLGLSLEDSSLLKDLSQVSKENAEEETNAIREKVNGYGLDELKKAAVEQAKAMLNLDLSDYAAKRDETSKSSYHNSVVFTKEGAPGVTGYFNAKGFFHGFNIEQ